MRVVKFCGLVALLIISTGTVFAQQPLISIQTDDIYYDEGDTIVVSGSVSTIIGDTPLIMQVIHEGTILEIAQITIAQDGSFTERFLAEKPGWKNQGEYTIKAFYQEYKVETIIHYAPRSELMETINDFEVDAGSFGTFDVEYTIKGGTVMDMVVDSEDFAIAVQINSTDDGVITLDLPREFIGAEKQNGRDEIFIILIDGIDVPYQEPTVHAESRIITVNFEKGDSDIKIIGTYVIPEFGSIVMIILIAGMMTVILASRNRFQIRA